MTVNNERQIEFDKPPVDYDLSEFQALEVRRPGRWLLRGCAPRKGGGGEGSDVENMHACFLFNPDDRLPVCIIIVRTLL
jgi:hypothetical protein